ncbi:PP2C family protein-serine/threonine phosphatase [Paenibacillus sp.]|uniref:PP2C family protein-serine/threonine phosphatase n=1 Tax=Paenibacillus sp. TaxID=58172 RepID=UPI002D6D044D|nr:SpoIIE family protein phosphatase [Paenibacillus sp.]HZG88360.1 SpoIIE family protein phosphatase [Paenibacillus sp.]
MIRTLLVFYYGAALAAVICMNSYNVGIDGSSLSHIFRFDFYFVTGSVFLYSFLLHRYTAWRLKPLLPAVDGGRGIEEERRAFRVLSGFPKEIFIGVFAAGAFISAVYHILEIFHFRIRPFDELVLRHIVVEAAFGFLWAFAYMSFARRMVRPALRRLQAAAALPERSRSFLGLWLSVFVTSLTVAAVPQIWFIRNHLMRDEQPGAAATAVVASLALAFAVAVLFAFILQFRRELRTLSDTIRAFVRSGPERRIRLLPVTSGDEIGELAAAFNALQTKAAKEDEELRSDLEMAEALQRMLLPGDRADYGDMRIRCGQSRRSAAQVGGDFYDWHPLPDGRMALLCGEVSGDGVAAALMTTAAVMLFRTEAREGGTAGELLRRLNASIYDTARGGTIVTAGLAIFGSSGGTLEYASAGHAAPLLLRRGAVRPVALDALPLGAAEGTVYGCERWTMEPGDRLLFYTSGVAERARSTERDNGFLALQRLAESVAEKGGAESLIEALLEATEGGRERHPSARTLLVVERRNVSEKGVRAFA